MGSIPGSGRSPGGGHGNPLQDSCLENSMDRGAWWALVHRVAQSQTRLKRLCTHTHKAPESLLQPLLAHFPSSSCHAQLLFQISVKIVIFIPVT